MAMDKKVKIKTSQNCCNQFNIQNFLNECSVIFQEKLLNIIVSVLYEELNFDIENNAVYHDEA